MKEASKEFAKDIVFEMGKEGIKLFKDEWEFLRKDEKPKEEEPSDNEPPSWFLTAMEFMQTFETIVLLHP